VRRGRRIVTPLCAAALALITVGVAVAIARSSRAHGAFASQCPDPYPPYRDPANPLMLPGGPRSDPLTGAGLFVDGPRHGAAAGAIESLLGIDPQSYPDDYSWAAFKQAIDHGRPHHKLAGRAHASLRWKVSMLEKIAEQPEALRFSIYSGGGGPGAIYGQVQKVFCHNLTADPGSIPMISTYFLHPVFSDCPTPSEVLAAGPAFRRRIDEMAAATGNRPAVYLLELDGVGSSRCLQRTGALGDWEADLRYEAQTMEALPHTVVYLEAGYSDANPAGYTARVLNAAGVQGIRGFFTNDTHLNWTIKEVRWAQRVSRLTDGAHFIVNTAQNGRGPKGNPDPVTQGNEDLCNPPGRGLGPQDTTEPGFLGADGFLWTHVPGNSSGSCGGGPAAGTFWPARAIGLAARANGRLGPGYPSRPY
jgi:Glycosyl hydrolases family 6